jgi:hypothetical protein
LVIPCIRSISSVIYCVTVIYRSSSAE